EVDPATGRLRDPVGGSVNESGAERANRYWDPAIMIDGKRMPTTPDDFGPDIFSKFACDFIRQHANEPFLMYYPMVLAHRDRQELPLVPDHAHPGRRSGDGSLKSIVEYLDHLVGRIRQTLEETNLLDNTYVIFTGDNGTAGDGKGNVTEIGVRVPL